MRSPSPAERGRRKVQYMSGSAVPASVVADVAAAARGYLRLAEGVEAGLLERLAASAVLTAEAFCGEAWVRRAFVATLPNAWGWQRLPVRPVVAVGAVTAGGVTLAVDAYAVDIDAEGNGWVRAGAAVSVAYSAGLATAFDAVPAPVAQGIVALTAHLFEARGGDALPPAAVAALWRPFRRLRLIEAAR